MLWTSGSLTKTRHSTEQAVRKLRAPPRDRITSFAHAPQHRTSPAPREDAVRSTHTKSACCACRASCVRDHWRFHYIRGGIVPPPRGCASSQSSRTERAIAELAQASPRDTAGSTWGECAPSNCRSSSETRPWGPPISRQTSIPRHLSTGSCLDSRLDSAPPARVQGSRSIMSGPRPIGFERAGRSGLRRAVGHVDDRWNSSRRAKCRMSPRSMFVKGACTATIGSMPRRDSSASAGRQGTVGSGCGRSWLPDRKRTPLRGPSFRQALSDSRAYGGVIARAALSLRHRDTRLRLRIPPARTPNPPAVSRTVWFPYRTEPWGFGSQERTRREKSLALSRATSVRERSGPL